MTDNKIKLIQREKYDVIVIGGGIAGVSAAVSAARNDMSVLLLEKQVNLGGLATEGLISWYEPLCDGKGHQIISGIAEELIKLACEFGFDNLPEKWGGTGKLKTKNSRYSTRFSPTVFSVALDSYVINNNVKIRFDSLATYPYMDGNMCKGIIVESVNGREFFESKVIIDATGNACIMERAGVPTITGENYMTYIVHGFDNKCVDELASDRDLCKFRHWINIGSDMNGNNQPKNLKKFSGDSAESITEYMIYAKKRLLSVLNKKNKYDYDIMAIPNMPQMRTIKKIVGDNHFDAIDGDICDNSIGVCGDFRMNNEGKHYYIPYGALFNSVFPNLLCAGRIISTGSNDGWEVSRVIPVCALTGEKAGRAASLMVKNNLAVDRVPIDQINI